MADPRSVSLTSQININLPTTVTSTNYSTLAKTLKSNMPIKLDKTNYIYWKTQVMPAVRALDLEDYISSSSVVPQDFIEVYTHNKEEGNVITRKMTYRNVQNALPNILATDGHMLLTAMLLKVQLLFATHIECCRRLFATRIVCCRMFLTTCIIFTTTNYVHCYNHLK
ncbi:hypothetical protein ACOSP7_009190 [Xanthoceras sorbifolium]